MSSMAQRIQHRPHATIIETYSDPRLRRYDDTLGERCIHCGHPVARAEAMWVRVMWEPPHPITSGSWAGRYADGPLMYASGFAHRPDDPRCPAHLDT